MILDKLDQYNKYTNINSGFIKAFEFLCSNNFSELQAGEYEIEGRDIFAIVVHASKNEDKSFKLEVHKKYIDIQFSFKGSFDIGWKALVDCTNSEGDFNYEKDVQFFSESYESRLILSENCFAIFFPEDAHAPIPPDNDLIKIVVKVKL